MQWSGSFPPPESHRRRFQLSAHVRPTAPLRRVVPACPLSDGAPRGASVTLLPYIELVELIDREISLIVGLGSK